jgi:hypothetical protein
MEVETTDLEMIKMMMAVQELMVEAGDDKPGVEQAGDDVAELEEKKSQAQREEEQAAEET